MPILPNLPNFPPEDFGESNQKKNDGNNQESVTNYSKHINKEKIKSKLGEKFPELGTDELSGAKAKERACDNLPPLEKAFNFSLEQQFQLAAIRKDLNKINSNKATFGEVEQLKALIYASFHRIMVQENLIRNFIGR